MITKLCLKCRTIKPVSDFRKNKNTKDGLDSPCTQCKKEYEKTYLSINREERRKKQRDFYSKNKKLICKKRKDNYDPIKGKARWLAKKIKTEKCIFCDYIGERHHKDYSHPLDIVFLCKSHHKQVHDGTIKI